MSGEKYITIPSPKKKKKKKKKKDNTDLMICSCIICFSYYIGKLSFYPLHHGLEIIPFSVLTDNDECIRIYYGEERTLVLLHCYPFSKI